MSVNQEYGLGIPNGCESVTDMDQITKKPGSRNQRSLIVAPVTKLLSFPQRTTRLNPLLKRFDRCLIIECLVTAVMVVRGGVNSQRALGAGVTVVPGLVESTNTHCESLKQLLNDISLGVIEIAAQISFLREQSDSPFHRQETPRQRRSVSRRASYFRRGTPFNSATI